MCRFKYNTNKQHYYFTLVETFTFVLYGKDKQLWLYRKLRRDNSQGENGFFCHQLYIHFNPWLITRLLPIKNGAVLWEMQLCPAGCNRPPSDCKHTLTLTSLSSHFLSWCVPVAVPVSCPGCCFPCTHSKSFRADCEDLPSLSVSENRVFLPYTRLWIKYDSFLLFVCIPPGVWGVYVSAESLWLSSNRWRPLQR